MTQENSCQSLPFQLLLLSKEFSLYMCLFHEQGCALTVDHLYYGHHWTIMVS